ncbi:MAG: LuxR C-terminal-related transcriptional regulator [Pseudomonadota bacterium]
MTDFETRWRDFSETLFKAEGVDAKFAALDQELRAFGYVQYNYNRVLKTRDGQFIGLAAHTNFDADYLAGYMSGRMYEADYTIDHCTSSRAYLPWSDMLSNIQSTAIDAKMRRTLRYIYDNRLHSGVSVQLSREDVSGGVIYSGVGLTPTPGTKSEEHDMHLRAKVDQLSALLSTLNAALDPWDVVESHFQLTEQQRTILRFLAAGHQIQQIADKVGLSDRAVGWHLQNIRTKLRTRSNAHSVALAMGFDLI